MFEQVFQKWIKELAGKSIAPGGLEGELQFFDQVRGMVQVKGESLFP